MSESVCMRINSIYFGYYIKVQMLPWFLFVNKVNNEISVVLGIKAIHNLHGKSQIANFYPKTWSINFTNLVLLRWWEIEARGI